MKSEWNMMYRMHFRWIIFLLMDYCEIKKRHVFWKMSDMIFWKTFATYYVGIPLKDQLLILLLVSKSNSLEDSCFSLRADQWLSVIDELLLQKSLLQHWYLYSGHKECKIRIFISVIWRILLIQTKKYKLFSRNRLYNKAIN